MTRNEAYLDEATGIYEFRGSSYGGCMHGLVMALRGEKQNAPDLQTRSRFGAGNQSEEAIKADLIRIGAATVNAPCGNLGVMWDAGPNFNSQRQVRGHYMGAPRYAHKLVPRDFVPERGQDHFVVQCSLDGWGLGEREFLNRVKDVYDRGCVFPGLLPSAADRFAAWVWEHKSVQKEKQEILLACCYPGKPFLIDPLKFQQAFPHYSWQLTAQVYGVHMLIWDLFEDDPDHHLVFKMPGIFYSTEVVQPDHQGSYFPVGRQLFYMERPPFTSSDVAMRLSETLRAFREGEVPKCDSEYRCFWPVPGPPQRSGDGPVAAGYKYRPPLGLDAKEGVSLAALAGM